MTATITKTKSGNLRIRMDGFSKYYNAYVQGAIVCDVTVTTQAAAKWHLVDAA